MKIHYKPISRYFPKKHPKEGQPTYFVEKIIKFLPENIYENYENINFFRKITDLSLDGWYKLLPKYHTIRQGNKVKVGDFIQFYCWGNDVNPKSGRKGPYHSKQIKIAPPIEVKKTWDFEIQNKNILLINELIYDDVSFFIGAGSILDEIAKNDGLSTQDLLDWFNYPNQFSG